MKFKFCGDLDCPDWALAAISLLTKLTSIKFRLLAQETVKTLESGNTEIDAARKICSDAKLSFEDTKIAVAAVEFFLSHAMKYGVNAEILSNELQQLGFPKEHATTLSKVYQGNPSLVEKFTKSAFRVSKLVNLKWRPHIGILTENQNIVPEPQMLLLLDVEDSNHQLQSYAINMPFEKLLILKHEVADILHIMESVPKI